MKRFYIFFVLVFLSFVSVAQVDKYSYPPVNREFIYNQLRHPSLSWSILDNTTEWNFSEINGQDSVKVKSLYPSDTPWESNFPGSSYVLTYFTPTDSTYYFYDLTDTALRQIGITVYIPDNNFYLLFRYDQPEVLIPFPFNVGDTAVSQKTASTTLYFQTVNLVHNDSVIALAQGYLTLPTGQTLNVMLLKHYVYIHIWADGVVDEEYEKIIYEWLGNSADKGNLFASADSNIVTGSFESIEILKQSKIASILPIINNLTVYPNPARDYVYIQGIDQAVDMSVFNLRGEQLLTANNTKEIDISHLQPGIYIIRISGKSFSLDYKIVKTGK